MTLIATLKRIGLAAAAAGTIVVAATAIAPVFVSKDAVRHALMAEMATLTGVEPMVRGETSVSLFPSPSVRLVDVSLGDPASAALTVDEVTGHLRLWPFLFGAIEISQVELIRPQLDLSAERPTSYLEAMAPADIAAAVGRAWRERRTSALSMVGDLRVVDGAVVVRDRSGNEIERASRVDMSFSMPASGRNVLATGWFTWHGQRVEATASATDLMALGTTGRSGIKLRLSAPVLTLAYDGMASATPGGALSGKVSLDSRDLRAALDWMGQPLPVATGFNTLALKANIQTAAASVTLTDAHIDLDGNLGEGTLHVARDNRAFIVRGTIAADMIEATPYVVGLQVFRERSRDWNTRRFDTAGLSSLDFDLRLSAGRIQIGATRIGRTALAATLRDGRLSATLGDAAAFGGSVKGTLAVVPSPAGIDARAQMQFTDVELDRALADLFGVRRIAGRGSVAFALETSGHSMHDLSRAINGTVRLTASDGSVAGVNAEQILRRLERRSASQPGDLASGRTPFERLVANFRVINGVATGEDIRLDGPSVKVAMGGSAQVPDRAFDLRGVARLVQANIAGIEMPFVIRGSWDNPQIVPDTEGLLRRSEAVAPLLDAVRERMTRDAVRSMIDQLTRPATP